MDDSGNGKLIDLERDSLGKANKNLIVSRKERDIAIYVKLILINISLCRVLLPTVFVKCVFSLAATISPLCRV